MMADQVAHLSHLNARDTTFTYVSRAPQADIERLKARMGWDIPWYTVVGTEFQEACGTTEWYALDVYVRDGDRAFLTYATTGRGNERVNGSLGLLDMTPYGRGAGPVQTLGRHGPHH